MTAFHQHVRRNGKHLARTWCEQRAIVADAKRAVGGNANGAGTSSEKTVD